MRKLLAACLALVMALTLTVPAFAAGEADVSIIGGADGPTAIFLTNRLSPSAPHAGAD